MKVAVLGMGAMGSRMAVNLLRAGHRVTVWNRHADRCAPLVAAGAQAAASPAAAVAGAEAAIAMLRDDDASREVWQGARTGALAAMADEALVVECSTLSPAWVWELAGSCRSRGLAFLDAPVAGSRPQAEAGQLIWLVGGEAEALGRATPLLAAMGGAVHHAGPAGSGAQVKLLVNALLAVQVVTMAELVALATTAGLDPGRAVEIITATPVCSPAAKAVAGAMLARNFAPMFPIDLVAKDLGYARAGAVPSAQCPMIDAAREVFAAAQAAGHGGQNMTGVVQLYLQDG